MERRIPMRLPFSTIRPHCNCCSRPSSKRYAVSLLNTDYYEEAREQFIEILRGHPAADYALYGLAVLDAITGQVEECLEHLARAIDGNPMNRLQARTDTDFQAMQDDPRFTELLYPEAP
jgi:tetratricopeptide (TPR) repeat protein